MKVDDFLPDAKCDHTTKSCSKDGFRAAQQHKKRLIPLRKTDAMSHAARHNGRTLDDIWKNGGNDVFQVSAKFSDKRISHITATHGS